LTRLAQLESALVKADAAGNVDDARALASAIRAERAKAAPVAEAPQPEAPSTLAQFGRAGGILARDVLEGGGGLVGLLTDPIVYGAGSATGQNFAGMKDTATQLADAIGLPKPETGTEQVVSRVQQALTGGAGTLSLARGLAG
jgi:hypothetical protein